MVKMSRMIPPTPVAAPWNGSIALGWLWLSILNAIAHPSPISTTPAFSSPALTRMLGPVVGNFFNSFREFLYEQCSLHITEKIPSSVKLGSRSRIFLMRSNSSGVRPCCATTSGVTIGSTVGAWLVIGTSRYRIRGPAQLRKLAISSNSGDAERSNRRRTRDTLGASVKSPSYEVWGEHQHNREAL